MNTRSTRRTTAPAKTGGRGRAGGAKAIATQNTATIAATPAVRVTRHHTRGQQQRDKVVDESVEEEGEPLDASADGDGQQQHQVMQVYTQDMHDMDAAAAQELVTLHLQNQSQQSGDQHMTTTIIQIIDDHNYEAITTTTATDGGVHEVVEHHVLEAAVMDDTGVQQEVVDTNTNARSGGAGGDDLENYWSVERSQLANDGRVDFVCKWMLCSFRTTSECSMRKHAIKHQKPYMCSFAGCGDRFTETQDLLQHFSATHMDTNAFKCTFADCQQRFKDIKSLTAHRVSHVSHTTQLIKNSKDYKPGVKKPLPIDEHNLYNQNNETLTATFEISGEGVTLPDGTQYYEAMATGSGDGQSGRYDRYRNTSRVSSVIRCPIGSLTDDIVEGNDNYVKCRAFDGKFWYKCLWDYCDYGNINEGIIRRHVLKHEFPHKCSFDGCSKSFATISEMAEHRSLAHTGPNPYRCDWPDCAEAFATLKLLTEHKTKHLSESAPPTNNVSNRVKKIKAAIPLKPFMCDFGKCNMHYATQEELDAHRQIHAGDRPFKCQFPDCTFAAKSKDKLQIHHSRHSSVKHFRCLWPTCDKSFTISEQLRRHRKLHTNKDQLVCEFTGCDLIFGTADELERHLRRHLGLEDSAFNAYHPSGFKCNFGLCKMHFQTREELHKHSQSHRGQRMYKCGYDNCSYSAKTLDKLTSHLRYHSGERPFKCDFIGCHQDFIQSHHLARHRRSHFGSQQSPPKDEPVEADDDDDRPIDCEFCGQEFTDETPYESHECPEQSLQTSAESNSKKRKHFANNGDESESHEDMDDNDVNVTRKTTKSKRNARKKVETSDESAAKTFGCSFGKCHYKGLTETDLTEHMDKLHSGDRPFACDYQDCTFKAVRKDKLNIHMRRHTGDRPYKCEWTNCNRTFISKDNLNRHNLTHFRSKSSNAVDNDFDRTLKELDDLLQDTDEQEVIVPTDADMDGLDVKQAMND